MYTGMDKAIVALLTALASILTIGFGWTFGGISEEHILGLIAVITPVLVWLIPNKGFVGPDGPAV